MPYHQALRLFSDNIVVIAWKDALLAMALPLCAICSLDRSYPLMLRSGLASAVVAALILTAWGVLTNNFLVVFEAVLFVFGSAACCVFFYRAIAKALSSGTIPVSLLLIILSCCIFIVWISMEERLGIGSYFTSDDEIAIGYGQRFDMARARASFDASFSAGQWIWFVAVTAWTIGVMKGGVSRFWLFVFYAIAFCGIVYTLSRGPLLLFCISSILAVIAFVVSNLKKRLVPTVISVAVLSFVSPIVFFVLPGESSDVLIELAASSGDENESSNQIRKERWQAGIDLAQSTFPWGRGVQYFNLKTLVGTGEINENTWLDYTTSLGVFGLLIVALYHFSLVLIMVKGALLWLSGSAPRNLSLLYPVYIGFPWIFYGFMFPTLASRFSCMIAWGIFGASCAFTLMAGVKPVLSDEPRPQ